MIIFGLLTASAFAASEDYNNDGNESILSQSDYDDELFGPMSIEEDLADLFDEILGITVPEKAKSLLGSERIQMHITQGSDPSVKASIISEDGVITEATYGNTSNPTLDIYLTAETYFKIRQSSDQFGGFMDAYNSGEIEKDAHGFFKSVKFAFAGAVLKIISWFN